MWGWYLPFQFLTKNLAKKGKCSLFSVHWAVISKAETGATLQAPSKEGASSETHLSQGQLLVSPTSQTLKPNLTSRLTAQLPSAINSLSLIFISGVVSSTWDFFFSFLSYTFRLMCIRCCSASECCSRILGHYFATFSEPETHSSIFLKRFHHQSLWNRPLNFKRDGNHKVSRKSYHIHAY